MDSKRLKRVAAVFAGAVALVAVAGFPGAGSSSAALASSTCAWPLAQPFLPWSGSGQYFLAPGEDFEGAMTGWNLAGGATVTSGNESSYVGSTADSHSLSLPSVTSSATTPSICVTTQSPILRFFARNTGKLSSQLAVYVNYTGTDRKLHSVKIAGLKAIGSSWTLGSKVSFINYVREPLVNGYAWITFTFKPNDSQGGWTMDDLYVDPIKSQ
jgi:hypothetical protein